jgi:hypothetical protein
MQNCRKGIYGFPEDVQDTVMFLAGFFDSGWMEKRDGSGKRRRINFMDDEFSGQMFSIVNEQTK